MAISESCVKFLKLFVLLAVLFVTCAQKCGPSEFKNSLKIDTSPGFLSEAILYVGYQECTESEVCQKIPTICPNSSCCISLANSLARNISSPCNLIQSKCGCWDSAQKTCKPVSNFYIGYSSCNFENGVLIQSKSEITRASREMTSKICKVNTAVVELIEGRGFNLRIQILACTQPPRRVTRQEVPGLIHDLSSTVDAEATGSVVSANSDMRDMRNTFKGFRSAKFKTSTNTTEFASQVDEHHEKYVPSQCDGIITENDTVQISSSFLSGTINSVWGLTGAMCRDQGHCKIPKPDCPSISCCVVSTSGAGNTFRDTCECLEGGINFGGDLFYSCLADYKIYKVSSTACTETGERVQRSMSVRIPSNGMNHCISDAESWETAVIKFETNENENLEAIFETRKCISSTENEEYLEIEEVIRAELSENIISQILKQIIYV